MRGALSALLALVPALSAAQDGPVADSIPTGTIAVVPLGAPSAGAGGVLPPAVTGLPADLWSGSRAAALADRIDRLPVTGIRSIDGLSEALLLAEAEPPIGEGEPVLLAKLRQLIARGRLQAAQALLDQGGTRSLPLRRLAFDVALLTGDETAACARTEPVPQTAEDYARRVFCLLRGGDWPAALTTFDAATALGGLDPLTGDLLMHFLDPELEEVPLPPPPPRPTPLQFRLYEALGQPMQTRGLPLAFAHGDRLPQKSWRTRIDAAERLAREGAITGSELLALYSERRPPASGAPWDRIAAVQALDEALFRARPAAVAETLPPAWEAIRAAGLEVAFAEAVAPRLTGLPLPREANAVALEIGLLSPAYEAAAEERGDPSNHPVRIAIAHGAAPAAPSGPLEAALAAGLGDSEPPAEWVAMAAEGRMGEALLEAASDLALGAAGDRAKLGPALAFLRHAGLEDRARRIALELLVADGSA